MDLQTAVANKWLFDTREEAKKALSLAAKQGNIYLVTQGSVTQDAMEFKWCSAVGQHIDRVDKKFQASILLLVGRMLDEIPKSANPYGIPLVLQPTTLVRRFTGS